MNSDLAAMPQYEGSGHLFDRTPVEMLVLLVPAYIVGLPYPGLHRCLPKADMGTDIWLQGCLALGKQGRSYHAGPVVTDVLGIRCISSTAECMWTKWPSAGFRMTSHLLYYTSGGGATNSVSCHVH